MFYERLKKFRKDLDLNKKSMSVLLGITDSYYSILENNKRKPSKKIIERLVKISGKPEEFWLYGIEKKKEKELTLLETSKVVNQLMELDLCNELFKRDSNGGFTILETSIENLLIQALKNDIDKHKNKSSD